MFRPRAAWVAETEGAAAVAEATPTREEAAAEGEPTREEAAAEAGPTREEATAEGEPTREEAAVQSTQAAGKTAEALVPAAATPDPMPPAISRRM